MNGIQNSKYDFLLGSEHLFIINSTKWKLILRKETIVLVVIHFGRWSFQVYSIVLLSWASFFHANNKHTSESPKRSIKAEGKMRNLNEFVIILSAK